MFVHYKMELLFAIVKGWNKDGIEWVQDYDSDNQQLTLCCLDEWWSLTA